MRTKVNQLVIDLLALTQCMPPAEGMGGSFLGSPPVSIPAPQSPIIQDGVTPLQIAALQAMVDDARLLVKGGSFEDHVHYFRSYKATVILCKKSLPVGPVHQCFSDVCTMLSNGNFGFTMRTENELREIHAAKVQRTIV